MAAPPAARAAPVAAQEDPALREAVSFYHAHATSDIGNILEATHRFEALAAEDPESWLRLYWTSFSYTQLGLFARDERQPFYEQLARVYYERAAERKPAGDARTDADFLALEGLLYSFLAGSASGTEAEELRTRSDEAWRLAMERDDRNPMAWMNRALGLLPSEETRNRGHDLAARAIELYEDRAGDIRPDWGREFIDVWTGSYPRIPGGAR